MLITLVGTIAAGFLGAGSMLLLRFVLRRFGQEHRMPGWGTPVAAGAFMLAATISSEYGWFANTRANLPDGVAVVVTREHSAPWQPWTYLRPYVNSFIAIDHGSVRTNADLAALRIVDLYIFTRWQAAQQMQIAVDCASSRRADPAEGIEMDGDGRPVGVTWRDVSADDPLYSAACS